MVAAPGFPPALLHRCGIVAAAPRLSLRMDPEASRPHVIARSEATFAMTVSSAAGRFPRLSP
jgi:hypothetical protein